VGVAGANAAYLFVKPASGWKTTSKFNAKLTATDGGFFGTSVSITGTTVVAGAPDADIGGNKYQGKAYVFGR
jgi:FG-GAP repeat